MIVEECEDAVNYDVKSLPETYVEGEKQVDCGENDEVQLELEEHPDRLMLRPCGRLGWLRGKVWLEKLLSIPYIELVDISAVDRGFFVGIHGGGGAFLPSSTSTASKIIEGRETDGSGNKFAAIIRRADMQMKVQCDVVCSSWNLFFLT